MEHRPARAFLRPSMASSIWIDLGILRRALSQAEAESIYIVGQNYGRSFDTYGPVKLTLQPSGTGFDFNLAGGHATGS